LEGGVVLVLEALTLVRGKGLNIDVMVQVLVDIMQELRQMI
jgi:hypothetical protein